MSNIHYQTKELVKYFSNNRIGWNKLYPSERKVFEKCDLSYDSRVIDMGCACGGAGVALKEKFNIEKYVGVDINSDCIDHAPEICPWGQFFPGDFLRLYNSLDSDFDLGLSLSCADWNVQTEDLLSALFSRVRNGGELIFSCRLTNVDHENGVFEAEQKILFGGDNEKAAEIAPYKVYNFSKMLDIISSIGFVQSIYGFGYSGVPPENVINLPLNKVYYVVFKLVKSLTGKHVDNMRLNFDIDANFFKK